MGSAFLVQKPRPAALRALNYTPETELLRQRVGSRDSAPLSELVSNMGASYWAVFTRLDCAEDYGVELLSQTDMFATEPHGRVIRKDSMPDPEKHRIHRWQILIAGAGQMAEGNLFGRSIIADARLAGKYLGPHAIALDFPDPGGVDNLWTYAFLNTRAGLHAIKAAAFGTSVPGLRVDLLADLPIPLPDDATQKRVADLIRRTVECRERYAAELRAARAVVEDLPEMQEALAMCAERRGRCVLWDRELPTLSAWTYASTGGALGYLKGKWSARLGDVLEPAGVFNGPRFARISCLPPHGIELLSQRDVFLIRPIPRRILHPGFSDEQIFASIGTLLVGGQGTLGEGEIFGRVILVDRELHQKAFTQHLLRVIPESSCVAFVYSFLSTLVGLRLVRSAGVGTKLLSLRPDLLRQLPIPDITSTLSRKIDQHIALAEGAKAESLSLEAEAIRIVEEEVIPSWLA